MQPTHRSPSASPPYRSRRLHLKRPDNSSRLTRIPSSITRMRFSVRTPASLRRRRLLDRPSRPGKLESPRSVIRRLHAQDEGVAFCMARRSTAQPVLPFGERPEQARRVEESEVARLERALGWEQILRAAFAEPDRNSGFLELAEEA